MAHYEIKEENGTQKWLFQGKYLTKKKKLCSKMLFNQLKVSCQDKLISIFNGTHICSSHIIHNHFNIYIKYASIGDNNIVFIYK